ncbi:MAG: DUF2079 domain-containing protein [Thermoleophilia bacterium]
MARRYLVYVAIAIVVAAAILSILAIQRYRNYYGGRFDMGNMVQAVYNTAHGHFLQATTADGKQASRLGSHVDPILAVFALPWLVWPSPEMLLIAQAVIVALAAWPAYRLGLRILRDARAAFFLAVALLLYPPLQYAVLNEFHPVTLAITFLLFAFVFIDEGHWWRALPFLVLAALCKEEIPAVIAVMGAYFALRKRSFRPLILTALAAAYFVFAVKVVLPHYSPGGSPFLNRYADLGSSVNGIGANFVLKPGVTLGHLFAGANLSYLFHLLWPFAFTSLLSPLTTLIAAPEYALNALASNVFQRSFEFHYVAGEVPFLFAGAVLGVARARDWLARGGRRTRLSPARVGSVSVGTLATVVLAAAVLANFLLGPLPFSLPGAHYSGGNYAVRGHAKVLDMAIKMIPSAGNVTVSTENNAGSHLSARRVIYTFPHTDNAQWIIVDQTNPFVFDHPDAVGHSEALGALVLNQNYQSVFARDGVYVFKRIGNATSPAGNGSLPFVTPGTSSGPTASPSAAP